jgi:release factor glutamine methyltransferase
VDTPASGGDLRTALRAATERLARAGVAAPRVDAELLAGYALGVPRSRLALAHFDSTALARFHTLVDARAARTPLQHLTGTAPFRHLDIPVGPGVFIPRPETELLVGWGLSVLPPAGAPGRTPLVLDLCSGSGAIALAVVDERPGTRVVAVEQDAAGALAGNVAALGLAVEVRAGDATAPEVTGDLDGTVDLVLCNPPYVPAGTPVAPEVAVDPPVAVFGGPDGLEVIRPVLVRAAALLRPGGHLGIEHDDSHGTVVPQLFRDSGAYDEVRLHHDLAGRPRFTTARRLLPG